MDTRIYKDRTMASLGSRIIISIALILSLCIGAVGDEVFTTYDLVSHGGGGQECQGSYNDNTGEGWGTGYQYNCIHSGLITSSGDLATTWYNYVIASAGTIVSENTSSTNPANNTATATETICPKGWSLPSKAQIDGQRNTISFSPVVGGGYDNKGLFSDTTRGYWWGNTAYNGSKQYTLRYINGSLDTASLYRYTGRYIRCVAKQKTITDLAYMQDVTDEVIVTRKFLVAGNFVI